MYSGYYRVSYLLSDALLAQELAAVPGELLIGYARGAAKLRGLQRGKRQLQLRGRAMGPGSACAAAEKDRRRSGVERPSDKRAGENNHDNTAEALRI